MKAAAYFKALRSRYHFPGAVNNDMLYLPRLQAIYVSISKNACSLVKSELYRMEHQAARPALQNPHDRKAAGFQSPADMDEAQFLELLLDRSIPKFAFVRDPLNRLKSCYKNRIQTLGAQPYDLLEALRREWIHRRQTILSELGRNRVSYQQVLTSDISFDRFVDFVCAQHPWEMDRHWSPQSTSLARDMIPYHFIGRVEEMDRDLNRVAALIGAEKDYHYGGERLNVSEPLESQPLTLAPELALRVKERYREDYQLVADVEREFR